MRLSYRFNQFRHALRSVPNPEDLKQIREFLPPELFSLFLQMQPAEQCHSIMVYHRLVQAGELHPELLTAALLHDVGKAGHTINPLERGVIVVVQALFPKWADSWHTLSADGWKRPFAVAASHPEWGARAAHNAGASAAVENLIRRHHEMLKSMNTIEDQLLQLLKEADGES